MQNISITDVPNQSILTTLTNQPCQLNLYQKRSGFFMDVILNSQLPPMLAGILCRNQCFCIMNAYFGFIGDFMWVDTQQQNSDPFYGGGLGTRFQLVYLSPADIPAGAVFAGAESTELTPPPG